MKNVLPLHGEDFSLFQELLKEASGLHFEEARAQSLQLALCQRLEHRGHGSYREYYHFLKFHPEGRLEMQELINRVTVGETFFFRNKPQFDVLMKSVLPEITRRKKDSGDKRIRVWSAGCSGGDEPYSIAMAFLETVPAQDRWTLSILGTDINRNGLTFAKEAIYNEKSIAYLPKEYLSKYFRVQGSNYALSPRVRKMVRFEHHNLVRDPYLHEGMKDVDILFCRNVTIYFDAETTRRVIDRFYNCLAPDGYLFLGHTETLWQVTNSFERVEYPQTFIYTRRRSPVLDEALKPFIAVPEVTLKDLTSPPEEEREKQASKERPVSRKSAAGSPRPSPKTGGPRNGTVLRTSLTQAALLANEARYGEAVEILGKVVEADNLSVEAYYLLGTLCYKSNDLQGAETHFRKVIYVDPDSALAYFNLGNLYLYQKKYREAFREFRNAARLLEKKPKEEPVRFCSDFTVEFLLRACRNNLLEISKRGEGHE